jgi:hypothetical protein
MRNFRSTVIATLLILCCVATARAATVEYLNSICSPLAANNWEPMVYNGKEAVACTSYVAAVIESGGIICVAYKDNKTETGVDIKKRFGTKAETSDVPKITELFLGFVKENSDASKISPSVLLMNIAAMTHPCE